MLRTCGNMYFAPHILYLRIDPPKQYDELGRPIAMSENDAWQEIGDCRCDDDTTVRLVSENGEVRQSKYHIVYEGRGVPKGGYVKCIEKTTGTVRGEGTVAIAKVNNYFNASDLWI